MHPMHTQAPGNRLAELRKARQVTLKELADLCGVYVSTVKRWETAEIPRQHLPALATRLSVPVPYLDGWTDDEVAA